MRFVMHKGDVHLPKPVEKAIEHKVQKVEEHLKRYHPDAADLELTLSRLDKQDEFQCAIQLAAFRETLFAKKAAPDLRVAVDKSFDALMKELDHYRAKINKSLHA